jgi:hypothetical protein
VTRRVGPLIALCCALCAFGVGTASAASQTRYVSTHGSDTIGEIPNPCTVQASPCLTFQHAVDEAASDDTVSVANGKYPGSTEIDKALTIVGQGPGTVIEGTGGDPAIFVGAKVAVSDAKLTSGEYGADAAVVAVTSAEEARGMLSLSRVSIEQSTSGGQAAAVVMTAGAAGLSLEASSVVGRGDQTAAIIGVGGGTIAIAGSTVSDLGKQSVAVELAGGSAPTVVAAAPPAEAGSLIATDSTFAGDGGLRVSDGTATLTRDTIRGGEFGLVQFNGSTVTLRDSLIAPASGGSMKVGAAVGVLGAETLNVIGSTVYVAGASGDPELPLSGIYEEEVHSGSATINVTNSIVRAVDTSTANAAADFLAAGAGTWNVSHTDFTTAKGPGVPAPGSGSNVAVAPAFADQAAGDYRLTEADTALIDAGDPAVVLPGETDLAGAPRINDGNCDGAAAPDLGAYELTRTAPCSSGGGGGGGGNGGGDKNGPPPPGGKGGAKKPAITSIKVKDGKAGPVLAFTLSEAAKVTIKVDRVVTHRVHGHKKRSLKPLGTIVDNAKEGGARSVPLASGLGQKQLPPGSYRLTLVATAGGLASGSYGTGFSVAQPAPPRHSHRGR